MSVLKADTIQSTSGGAATLTKQSAPKLFLGAGSSAVIVDSLNISSSSDEGTGDYSYNTTNAFNYAIDEGCGIGGCCSGNSAGVRIAGSLTTASVISIQTELFSDGSNVNVRHHLIINGDLA